ncbi:MAG: dihydrodipicolinate synthase family protein [Chloroflexi bacterium]|nr:MAG: dihydrodipicolinate synthase family protein [Chloroflexota bacterium]
MRVAGRNPPSRWSWSTAFGARRMVSPSSVARPAVVMVPGSLARARARQQAESGYPSAMADRSPLIVAAATPLTGGGEGLDEGAIWPMVSFLVERGADGIFACGTTGEGILLSGEERRRAAVIFRAALHGDLIVHCGAQTTAETVALAAHAAEIGADAVAVIPPPYFPLDVPALSAHLLAAAAACGPLPFYIYCFTARSGYPVPIEVIELVRQGASNLAGLKVSESPFERVAPYLELGLPVFVGSEPLIPPAMARGAHGAVSGLAAAFPEVVRAALDTPSAGAEATLGDLRAAMEAQPFIASVKHVLARRGLPVREEMRAPMRPLSPDESARLDAALARLDVEVAA